MSENDEVQAPSEPLADADNGDSAAPEEVSPPEAAGEEAKTGEKPSAKDEKAKPKKSGIAKRFSELTAQLREAERRAEAAEQAAKAPQVKQDAPKPDDFDSYEDFLVARTEWTVAQTVEQRLKEAEAKREKAELEAQRRAREAALDETWAEKESAAFDKWDDYQDVVYSDDLRISEPMAKAIKESDLGPDIAYYLGKHPAEAATIAARSTDYAQAAAIGAIEERLKAKASAPAVSRAPPPPDSGRTTGDNASLNNLSDKADMKAWMAARRKQLYG